MNFMKMKTGPIWSILGVIELIAGFCMYLYTKWEMATNTWYSWKTPYTEYEAKIMIIQLIGIVLLVFGFGNLISAAALKINRTVFADRHIRDVDFSMTGALQRCPRCGVTFLAGTEFCPNCGMAVRNGNNKIAGKQKNRTSVTIAMNTNQINDVIQLVAGKLEYAGYRQKILDGETVWIKGDGAAEILQCIQLMFTEKSAVIQAWTTGVLAKEADLEGNWSKPIRQQMKNIIGELCREIRLRNL